MIPATVPPASTAVSACAATAKTSAGGATNVPVADGAHAGVELGEVAPPVGQVALAPLQYIGAGGAACS